MAGDHPAAVTPHGGPIAESINRSIDQAKLRAQIRNRTQQSVGFGVQPGCPDLYANKYHREESNLRQRTSQNRVPSSDRWCQSGRLESHQWLRACRTRALLLSYARRSTTERS